MLKREVNLSPVSYGNLFLINRRREINHDIDVESYQRQQRCAVDVTVTQCNNIPHSAQIVIKQYLN